MKHIKIFAAFLAIIFVATSAFTSKQGTSKPTTITEIWFDVSDAGTALDNPVGLPSESTYSCPSGTELFCQKAFRYDDANDENSQVELSGTDYILKSGVNVATGQVAQRQKPE